MEMGDRLWIHQKTLKNFGTEGAIIIGELLQMEALSLIGGLTQDGFFKCPVEFIESDIHVSAHKQRSVFKVLSNLGVIDCKLSGIPRTRYVRVNHKILEENLSD